MKFLKCCFFSLVITGILLGLFGTIAFSENIKIINIGPGKIKVGSSFNMQSNGQSAIWVKTENATKETVIVWGDKKLLTTYGNAGLLTAFVPKELYSKPGIFKIYLLNQKNKAKSNSFEIIVEK